MGKVTIDDECFHHNKERLPLPIQMQLSKKPNTFCCFFIAFLESTCNFEHFELYSLNISEIINSERRGYLNA